MRPSPSAQRLIRHLATVMFLVGGTQACLFARPARSIVGNAPVTLGVEARTVNFPSQSGSVIRAWFVPGRPGGGAVLLLHGMGSNRMSMLTRASFLHRAGFTILAPDF